jgi:hypothetical protein
MDPPMSDDYLWDGTGTPDPDVQRLEALLGSLRSAQAGAPRWALPVRPARWATPRFIGPALAAAAAVTILVGIAWQTTGRSGSWEVASVGGRPRIGSSPFEGTGRLAVGQTLITDGASRARLTVSTIGEVTVDPGTRVRLVETRDGHHRLALASGTLRAVISAPPGQFIVTTRSATAIDLGCAYTLQVDEDGSGLLSVTRGWVALELDGRESFVPAGASSRTDAPRGPGTPRYDDASEELREALDEFDFGADTRRRSEALRFVLDQPDASAVTLWHLIPRVSAAERGAVVDALADQLPMPAGVTRDAVLRLDRGALDRWWDELGLGDAGWWRMWKAPYQALNGAPPRPRPSAPSTPSSGR